MSSSRPDRVGGRGEGAFPAGYENCIPLSRTDQQGQGASRPTAARKEEREMTPVQTQPAKGKKVGGDGHNGNEAQPVLGQQGREIQPFGTVIRLPIGLDESARKTSVDLLNQILADTMSLRDLYKKHHWQTSGPTFYQ